MGAANGRNGSAHEGVLSHDQVISLIDHQSREVLGKSGSDALDMLDRGELEGSIFESHLRLLRFLAGNKGALSH